MEPYDEEDEMNTQPETPSVNEDTPVSPEDQNEYLLGDDELGIDEVEIKEEKEEEDDG